MILTPKRLSMFISKLNAGGDDSGGGNGGGGNGIGFDTGGGFGIDLEDSAPDTSIGLGPSPEFGTGIGGSELGVGFDVGELSSETPPETFGQGFLGGLARGAIGGGVTGGLPGAVVGGLTQGVLGGLEATGGFIPGINIPNLNFSDASMVNRPGQAVIGGGMDVDRLNRGGPGQVTSSLGNVAIDQPLQQPVVPLQPQQPLVLAPQELTQPQFSFSVEQRNPLQELALSGFR